jgi:hypothetical protein
MMPWRDPRQMTLEQNYPIGPVSRRKGFVAAGGPARFRAGPGQAPPSAEMMYVSAPPDAK